MAPKQAPKLNRLHSSEIPGNYALRPPSPVLARDPKAQRKSDEKAARFFGVKGGLVEYCLATKIQPQQNPE
jgi:hypothetical protein